ncbi:hypothetical protein EIP91_002111 [Steccherinum ochraceum]|uniref:F-box domain-containing protein n=1 Tax=Steccherinum ochraceum TaxID=92696 RepID=A0A4R0RVK2_9APHY|nr:hypothetical protein EIP91_002111 [Steccherinum ochraceum]
MTPFLAPELRLNIARFVDRPTLLALRLASQDWLGPAQVMLFQEFRVSLLKRPIQHILRFLESSSHLRTYVTHLYLFGEGWHALPTLRVEDLFMLLNLFPSIRSVTIDLLEVVTASSAVAEDLVVPSAAQLRVVLSRLTMDKATLNILLTRISVTELHIPTLRLAIADSEPLQHFFHLEMFKFIRILNRRARRHAPGSPDGLEDF